MASAKEFIGKTLYAKKPVIKYRSPGDKTFLFPGQKKLYVFQPGEIVGVIYSWQVKDGKLYWMFLDDLGKSYHVLHTEDSFELTKQIRDVQDVAEAKDKAEKTKSLQEAVQIEKEAKGDVGYYIEKYVPYIIGAIVLVALGKSVIQKKL